MPTSETQNGMVKSDATLFSIIECMSVNGAVGVTELSDEVSMPKSTVHKHLKTLEQFGYVIKKTDSYALSFQFLTLGGRVRNNHPLCNRAGECIRRLGEETDRLASFAIKEHNIGIFTHAHNDRYGLGNNNPIGKKFNLHQNAPGKAILARLSNEEIELILTRKGLPQATENTIKSRDELFNQIEQIRKQGFAISVQERVKGVDAVSASVLDPRTESVGAVTISIPGNRLGQDDLRDKYATKVMDTAGEMELQIRQLENS